VYRQADRDAGRVPWADLGPNPHLTDWAAREHPGWRDQRLLVVGCGLGDDAEFLAGAGADVTAFDLSPTAIDWCRRRFRDSRVTWLVADLFEPPAAWRRRFDFVFEAYTLQSLAAGLRAAAVDAIAAFIAPGGQLLLVARGREPDAPAPSVPWPLTRREVEAVTTRGLDLVRFEDYDEAGAASPRRFRALFRRPSGR